jgi:hypothetical protein
MYNGSVKAVGKALVHEDFSSKIITKCVEHFEKPKLQGRIRCSHDSCTEPLLIPTASRIIVSDKCFSVVALNLISVHEQGGCHNT